MQTKITSCLIGLLLWSLAEGRPQSINNYPFRPTFSDLDQYNSYTTQMPYMQNRAQAWPYTSILDQAVSPLYNANRVNNGYLASNGYTATVNNGYNPNGYLTNSNGYSNSGIGYTTMYPYIANTNPFGIYNGKK